MTGRATEGGGLIDSLAAFAAPRMALVIGVLAVGVLLIVIGVAIWLAG